ncbi:MAG: hypothetical protein QGH25_00445 [Candidatus Latescibacteria bacterium]|jgi:hypothetical protein|nr:hypothetical protein [Candidatus Latescibacterota bacterium]
MQKRRDRGKETPGVRKALDEVPELADELRWIFRAFLLLSAGRGIIGGFTAFPAPLAFEAIALFATRYGLHGIDEFDYFHTLLRAMDDEFMTYQIKEMKRKGNK